MRLIICSISFGFLGLVIGASLAQLLGGVVLGIIGFFGPPLYVLDKLYAKSMREDTDKYNNFLLDGDHNEKNYGNCNCSRIRRWKNHCS